MIRVLSAYDFCKLFLNKKLCPRFYLIRAELVRYWDYAWHGTDK
jgi:hypothetical protein